MQIIWKAKEGRELPTLWADNRKPLLHYASLEKRMVYKHWFFSVHQGARTLRCQETPPVLKWNKKTVFTLTFPIWFTVWLRWKREKNQPARCPDWRGQDTKRSCTHSPHQRQRVKWAFCASNPVPPLCSPPCSSSAPPTGPLIGAG